MNYIMQPHTTPSIIKRNRANALKSTGPKTANGKSVSRQNALKHGLCANPASGIAECPNSFLVLHKQLNQVYAPTDPVEQGLVHRIAVALWRLQRATYIDAATSNICVNAASSIQERTKKWIDQITELFWRVDYVRVTDRDLISKRVQQKRMRRGDIWWRHERANVFIADSLLIDEIMQDGAGIAALSQLIDTLIVRLESRMGFSPVEAQMLAWLLGESVGRLRPAKTAEDQQAMFYPDEQHWASHIDGLIGQARNREEGSAMPEGLLAAVNAKHLSLHTQAKVVNDPHTAEQDRDRHTLALLPEPMMLDRLVRYENHAERSLHKSLEVLAKYRGLSLESVKAAYNQNNSLAMPPVETKKPLDGYKVC